MKRLHKYITTDLVKATCMAAVAFTLLMTVIGLIEPMRKRGLGPSQVALLFGFTLPVMLSLTLPIAAVFAATLVYGRFSQDNELTACRASGVSTFDILKPALGLGAVVTVVALLMGNFVAPALAGKAGTAILSNAQGYVFNVLKRRGTIQEGRVLIRGDRPDLGEERIHGVVLLYLPDMKDIRIEEAEADALEGLIPTEPDATKRAALQRQLLDKRDKIEDMRHDIPLFAAATAEVAGIRTTPQGDFNVALYANHPLVTQEFQLFDEQSGLLNLPPLPNPSKEKTRWFSWNRLLAILNDPTNHSEIRRELQEHQRAIAIEQFYAELIVAVEADLPYAGLRTADGSEVFRITAASIKLNEESVTLSDGLDGANHVVPVKVDVLRNGELYRTITGPEAEVTAGFTPVQDATWVTIKMRPGTQTEPILIQSHDSDAEPVRQESWTRAELPLPIGVRDAQERIDLSTLCHRPETYTDNPGIIESIQHLRDERMPHLVMEAVAEMHQRVAYGASCFMMVAMGAVLGLLFRGGQVVTAFALTVVPSAVVILMVYMGNQMIRNPEVPLAVGVAALWSGIGLITLANGLAYGHLARR